MTDTIYLPATSDRPAEPAPYVLTEADAARLLRLEVNNPYDTLYRYRKMGRLRATQIGASVRFLLPDVVAFLKATQEENPR